jgi:hypothetical protein
MSNATVRPGNRRSRFGRGSIHSTLDQASDRASGIQRRGGRRAFRTLDAHRRRPGHDGRRIRCARDHSSRRLEVSQCGAARCRERGDTGSAVQRIDGRGTQSRIISSLTPQHIRIHQRVWLMDLRHKRNLCLNRYVRLSICTDATDNKQPTVPAATSSHFGSRPGDHICANPCAAAHRGSKTPIASKFERRRQPRPMKNPASP